MTAPTTPSVNICRLCQSGTAFPVWTLSSSTIWVPEDNSYVRAVTRKTLCAAVRRVQEPGVKFDTMLVLNGPQGIGKSTLLSLLPGSGSPTV